MTHMLGTANYSVDHLRRVESVSAAVSTKCQQGQLPITGIVQSLQLRKSPRASAVVQGGTPS
jgi:hypothetical protein